MYFRFGVKVHKSLGKEGKPLIMMSALIDMFASAFHKVNISINSYLGFRMFMDMSSGNQSEQAASTCLPSPVLVPCLNRRLCLPAPTPIQSSGVFPCPAPPFLQALLFQGWEHRDQKDARKTYIY